jgi:hypothetical protein
LGYYQVKNSVLKVELCDQPSAGCLTASEAAAAPIAKQLRIRKGLTDVQARAVFDQYKTTKARAVFTCIVSPTRCLGANALQCPPGLPDQYVGFEGEKLEVMSSDHLRRTLTGDPVHLNGQRHVGRVRGARGQDALHRAAAAEYGYLVLQEGASRSYLV